jgi:hypothetical protein
LGERIWFSVSTVLVGTAGLDYEFAVDRVSVTVVVQAVPSIVPETCT